MSPIAEARKIPYLPNLAILTGITLALVGVSSAFVLGMTIGMVGAIFPWVEIPEMYYQISMLSATCCFLVGIGWIFAGIVWHIKKV